MASVNRKRGGWLVPCCSQQSTTFLGVSSTLEAYLRSPVANLGVMVTRRPKQNITTFQARSQNRICHFGCKHSTNTPVTGMSLLLLAQVGLAIYLKLLDMVTGILGSGQVQLEPFFLARRYAVLDVSRELTESKSAILS